MKKYKPEQVYHMHLHIVIVARNRSRIFRSEEMWKTFTRATAECCAAQGTELLKVEQGLAGKSRKKQYADCTAHIQVLIRGNMAPSEICAAIREKTGLAMQRMEGGPKRNPWPKDFFITDDAHYSNEAAAQFANRRYFRTKELLYEEL